MKVVAYPVERRCLGVGVVPAPGLHEEVEEDHVVGEAREFEVRINDDDCDELRDGEEVFQHPVGAVVRIDCERSPAYEVDNQESQ